MEPATLARLEAADLPARWPPAAEAPWYELRPGPDGSAAGAPTAWLARRDGACVFLGDDGRCAVHALLGEDAKPAFCREFPFHLVRERDHYSAVVRAGCSSWHRSRVDGAPVGPQAASLPSLPRAYPVASFEPERVEILPGLGLDLEAWYRAEPAILQLLDAPDEAPEATVAALRGALARATGRDQPPPDPARFDQALTTVLSALQRAITPSAAQLADPERRARLQDLGAQLERALAPGPLPSLAPCARAAFNELLRASVLGKLFHRWGGLPRALALLLVELHIGRANARPRADGRVDADALAEALLPWWNLAGHGAIVEALRSQAATLDSLFTNAVRPRPPSSTETPNA